GHQCKSIRITGASSISKQQDNHHQDLISQSEGRALKNVIARYNHYESCPPINDDISLNHNAVVTSPAKHSSDLLTAAIICPCRACSIKQNLARKSKASQGCELCVSSEDASVGRKIGGSEGWRRRSVCSKFGKIVDLCFGNFVKGYIPSLLL